MYSGVIHFCYLSSLAILATPVASLPVTSTDDDSLPSRSSSPAEATTAAPPHAKHTSHPAHHPPLRTHSHSFLNPPAAPPAPTTGLTSPHDSPPSRHPSSQAHKGLTVIVFASIGGVIGLFLLALCTRRAIAHCRMPRHTVVLTVAERAQLVQEIAEYAESASRRQCHSLTGPPPPPYEHAPSYDSLTPHRS
ncbi:hypothetical protein EDB89DRAFT_490522 [Lactarius sanguifluus]|nr:hypothetical protein EDB89DRAFT_490522 [Lactarius sanguifluus]